MWEVYWKCMSCKEELTQHQHMYSWGICPHCGFKSRTGATICEAVKSARKWVWDEPALSWWDWLKGKKRKGHWEYK